MAGRKIALVTGGSSGIGMGIALELAGKGYDIAFTYRKNAGGASAVQAQIEALGAQCCAYQISLEALEGCAALVDRVRADFGRIDAMVCNAASDRRMSILTATPEDLISGASQLYAAQMLLAGAAARHMVKDGVHGAILFITSVHGQMPTTNDFLYGGMKAAIERSCQSLALELSPYRIRVNCIAPGAINVRHLDDAQRKYPYSTMVPLGRWGVEADIGHAAAFLLSDAADYITGETLRVDGGFALPGVPEGWAEPHPVDQNFVRNAYEQMLKREEETDNG
ncbi:MAG TPA: SDR family oxidoreductase [Candidatus Alectryocaccomicrobium excrementavium]|uniref:SDR family oxidoreductase n=1 Tax=Candidatus Alectryocaccomicrobium excrementavium TaxID=2840668 RepID=A0A9D1G2B6_9FIRM|nr:SDR family oxidoreductase [Candidatus Alectryocaccomicrobium excrementavium]